MSWRSVWHHGHGQVYTAEGVAGESGERQENSRTVCLPHGIPFRHLRVDKTPHPRTNLKIRATRFRELLTLVRTYCLPQLIIHFPYCKSIQWIGADAATHSVSQLSGSLLDFQANSPVLATLVNGLELCLPDFAILADYCPSALQGPVSLATTHGNESRKANAKSLIRTEWLPGIFRRRTSPPQKRYNLLRW